MNRLQVPIVPLPSPVRARVKDPECTQFAPILMRYRWKASVHAAAQRIYSPLKAKIRGEGGCHQRLTKTSNRLGKRKILTSNKGIELMDVIKQRGMVRDCSLIQRACVKSYWVLLTLNTLFGVSL